MGYLIHHNSRSSTVVLAKGISNKDEVLIDINPNARPELQEIVKYLNQRIYGVYVENEQTRIKLAILDIYKMYLNLESISFDEIDEENKENESPEECLERLNECERYLQQPMTKTFKVKKVEFVASIFRKPDYCTIKTTTFDPVFLSIIKAIDKKNRTYNLMDKSWQIKGDDVISKFIEDLDKQCVKFFQFC